MLNSWWQLGEGSGFEGSDLEMRRIQCPFCYEKGIFETVFHEEKRKPNSKKKLNFDVCKCGNCMGFVHVLWSLSERNPNTYDYRVLPRPINVIEAPEHWPEEIQSYWVQAHKSLMTESWDAAALMARSALQLSLRDHEALGGNLKPEIDDLASKGILPPVIKEWSDELRLLGNISAHPRIGQGDTNPRDVEDIVQFLDYLLHYLYDLPKRIADYRARRNDETEEI